MLKLEIIDTFEEVRKRGLIMKRSVLKYPGSKWNLASWIISLIPEHHAYVELFFGSGAVFFSKPPSNIETINDLDSNVYNLYKTLRDEPGTISRLVAATPFSREEYDNTFECDWSKCSEIERLRMFLVQCWQGHGFRTNGYKVGWKNDVVGREQMYAAYNWYRLPQWLMDCTDRLKQVQVENQDYLMLMQRYDYENVFFYLDPPYLMETRAGKQYAHEFDDIDHAYMLNECIRTTAKVMVSGYESQLYDYVLCEIGGFTKVSVPATAEYGLKRKEVVWMNYKTDEHVQMQLF